MDADSIESVGALSAGERSDLVVALIQSSRGRYREKEEDIWRLNYATWTLLVAIGAAVLNPEWPLRALGWPSVLIFAIPALHGWAVVKHMRSIRYWRSSVDHYTSRAEVLLGTRTTLATRYEVGSRVPLEWTDCEWVVLQVAATLAAALLLIGMAW